MRLSKKRNEIVEMRNDVVVSVEIVKQLETIIAKNVNSYRQREAICLNCSSTFYWLIPLKHI